MFILTNLIYNTFLLNLLNFSHAMFGRSEHLNTDITLTIVNNWVVEKTISIIFLPKKK